MAAHAGSCRWLIGVFVTAVLFAGASTALTWVYTHAALTRLAELVQPLTETTATKIRRQHAAARVFGRASIFLVLTAGAAYLMTVWLWAVRASG